MHKTLQMCHGNNEGRSCVADARLGETTGPLALRNKNLLLFWLSPNSMASRLISNTLHAPSGVAHKVRRKKILTMRFSV